MTWALYQLGLAEKGLRVVPIPIKAGQAQSASISLINTNNFEFVIRKGQRVAIANLCRQETDQSTNSSLYPSVKVYDDINSFTQPFRNMDKLVVVPLSENAFVPTKGSGNAAGMDLYSAYNYTIEAGNRVLIKTDLKIQLPFGTYGRIAPRSGLASKCGIDISAGVIDPDYRGNVQALLVNHSNKIYHVSKGDKVCQMICEKFVFPEIEVATMIPDTERSSRGFGSSGR